MGGKVMNDTMAILFIYGLTSGLIYLCIKVMSADISASF